MAYVSIEQQRNRQILQLFVEVKFRPDRVIKKTLHCLFVSETKPHILFNHCFRNLRGVFCVLEVELLQSTIMIK